MMILSRFFVIFGINMLLPSFFRVSHGRPAAVGGALSLKVGSNCCPSDHVHYPSSI